LIPYLLDFLLVAASFVVWYLGFQFVNLLLVLPVRTRKWDSAGARADARKDLQGRKQLRRGDRRASLEMISKTVEEAVKWQRAELDWA
jgi:uncharacterized protein HemY